MEYNQIKKIIGDMEESTLDELSIEFSDGTKIMMKKNQNNNMSSNTKVENKSTNIQQENTTKQIIQENREEGNIVKSPMVGTFYIKPSPTSEPFVEIGKSIKKGDTLCIIEAMKLMNEIESEFTGNLAEILVQDGQTVEYGTPLFIIK